MISRAADTPIANASPWKKLAARRNITLKLWPHTVLPDTSNPYALALSLSSLLPLLTSKTRLVAFSACSNILGSITDVAGIVKAVRARCVELGARKIEFCLDCVAYAPHRRIDVRAWDIEYCYFSYYKVYGPHVGAIYARKSSLTSSLTSLTHHFLNIPANAYKLCPGGTGYEVTYAVTAVVPYLVSLSSPSTGADVGLNSDVVAKLEESFAQIAAYEQELLFPLIGYLTGAEAREKGVLVVGSERIDESRAPTVSFVVRKADGTSVKSRDIVGFFDRKGKASSRKHSEYHPRMLIGFARNHRWASDMATSTRTPLWRRWSRRSTLLTQWCASRLCTTIPCRRSRPSCPC